MAEQKKLSSKDIKRGFWYWQFWAMSTLSYEKLEANGFAHSMIPIAERLYGKGTKEFAECLDRHTVFYNTEPQTGSIVNGIVASMEEGRANGENVDDSAIHTIKSALMGPIAGIGDSVVQGILIPLLLSIGMSMSTSGSPSGVIFYIIVYNVVMLSLSYYLYKSGYKMGVNAIDLFMGEKSNAVRSALNILGIMVAGGLAANFVKLSTVLKIYNGVTNSYFVIQDTFDSFFPGLLGLLAVLLSYWLIRKHGMSSNKVLLILIAVAVVGVLLGIF